MDWILEISEFPQLELSADSSYVSERDTTKAIQKYDKAVMNAVNDSVDIAIIELRKLAVLYPQTGQINVLLGCCQMIEGRYEEARRNFERAMLKTLPAGMHDKAAEYLELAVKGKEDALRSSEGSGGKRSKNGPVPEIIAADPGRWKKRKMASEKEKREIIHKLNSPQVAETFINDGIAINWLRIFVIALVLMVLAGMISVSVIFIPKLINTARENTSETADKLDWLLSELEKHKDSNSLVGEILKEYDNEFYPSVPSVTPSEISDIPSPTEGESSPTPSPEPTTGDVIIAAYDSIKEAEETGRSDPAKVMRIINEVRDALEGIDDNITADDLQVNVGDILQIAYQLEKSVVNAACYTHYRDGKAFSEQKDHEAAAQAFKKAYDINPDYLDGGNTYNLAKAYAALGRQAEANTLFQYVVDTFPGTDYAGWSAARIKPIVSEGE